MIICICSDISDKDIVNYMSVNQENDFISITKDLSCCNNCGVCTHEVQDIITLNSGKIYALSTA